MKKLILTTLLFAGIATAGFSQNRPARDQNDRKEITGKRHDIKEPGKARLKRESLNPEQRAQRMTDAMDKKLALNAKQKQEVYKINLERAKEMEKHRVAARKASENEFKKMRKSNEDKNDKISKLLSADQRKTWAEVQSKRKDRPAPRGTDRQRKDMRGNRDKV